MGIITLILILSSSSWADDHQDMVRFGLKFMAAQKRYSQVVSLSPQSPTSVLSSISLEQKEITEDDVAAHCVIRQNGTKSIVFNPESWERFTDLEREMTIYHELGHCLLNRDHVDDFISLNGESVPKSLMSSVKISAETYAKNLEYYLSELFSGGMSVSIHY